MKKQITQNLIAPCGMNCGLCRAHLRKKSPCPGCYYLQEKISTRGEQRPPRTRADCKMRNCTKRRGQYCCSCPEFPCDRLRQIDKRYRTKYGMSEIENLEFIKKNGIRKFVSKERKRWISEKGLLCVHDKKYYK